jgi:uncharacterized membrane protein YhaH (DUF805 family)
MTQPIPGWYSDPTNPLQERLWDGATWTDQVRPQSPTSMPPPPPGLAAYDSGNSLLRPTFVEAVKEALQRFFKFKGRSSRRAYWFFSLFSFLANFGESLLLGTGLLGLVLLVPGLAVAVRRMHDVDRSGWFILLPFVNLYFLCQSGDRGCAFCGAGGQNRYGAPPR